MPIYEGVTAEEAVEKGLIDLGVAKDQVTIEVLEEAKKGFLGFGKKGASVRLEILSATEDVLVEETIVETSTEAPVTEVEEKLATTPIVLEALDDEAALTQLALYLTNISKELGAPALVKMSREDHLVVFQLETSKQGILIGKHGKTLNALQYLSQVFIHRVAKNKISLVINVGNYREKREVVLQRLAERTAEKVDRTGRPVFLEPMPAFERKLIHSALSKKDYVKTHSEGDEPYRYLVVEPAKKYY